MSLIDQLTPLTRLYDTMHHWWEHPRTLRYVAAITLLIYVLGLLGIEARRVGMLPPSLAAITPTSHIWAIHLAFTVILGVEVISLIFSLSASFSRSVGKQLEILTLILLRNAFKELGHLPEPISVAEHWQPIVYIATYALGALAIFIVLRVFLHIYPHGHYIQDRIMCAHYTATKKLLALLLLCITAGIGIRDVLLFLNTGESQNFFATIYTVLIFADITLVLVAQRYMPSFHAVFRNSGYVIATLMMRLALSASAPLDTAISLFSGFYVLALAWSMNYFERLSESRSLQNTKAEEMAEKRKAVMGPRQVPAARRRGTVRGRRLSERNSARNRQVF